MDFENMKRKQLQALCKEHGIPANLTNLEMVNKLTSLLKVNDEKPSTRGRSCLKILDEDVNDRESDVVNRKVKKVKFSPDNEIIEFTRSVGVKRGGRKKKMLYKNNLDSDELKTGILDSPVRVTRSRRVNMEDGVNEKKGAKDSVMIVNESKDEGGVTTRRSLKNKEVVNEGVNDGLRSGRRVRSRKVAKESVEDTKEEIKTDDSDEKEIDRTEKKDKKVTFVSGGEKNECTKSETEAKETRRVMRRKSTAPIQNEVDAEVRGEEEVVEKPARVTRSRNLKPVEDNVSNKRNPPRSEEVIETSEKEVGVKTRRSQQISVVEAPQEASKRSGRVANKAKGGTLADDVSKQNIVIRSRTRNQSNLTVEASTSESGTDIVEPEKLEEPVEVPPRRSGGRRKSLLPLKNLGGDDVASKKEKSNILNSNDDEQANKGITEEPPKALKRSKRLATQVEDSVMAKDDIPESEVVPVRSSRRKSVVPSLENVRSDEVTVVKEKRKSKANEDEIRSKVTKEEPQKALKRSKRLATQVDDSVIAKEDIPENEVVPVRSSRRKSVVPSLENVRSDEVAVVKEKRKSKANEDEIRSKVTKEEPQKASKRSKRLAKQVEDPVLDKGDIAETKLEERRCSRRNAGIANVVTEVLDRSVEEETSAVKEERRRSGRSAVKHTLAAVSDDKKEKGESKLSKRNKFALQDLDSPKQCMSSSKASVKTTVAIKTSTAGKKQQGRIKRSNVEVEAPVLEDMETVREPDNVSASALTISFSRSSLNEVEPVPDDVNVVPAGIKDDAAAESSTQADKLNEEGLLVDAYTSPSENNSASKSVPFINSFTSDARHKDNSVEELLKSDHEEPASEGLRPSSVLSDDALPNDITSDKQEPSAIAADSAEEFGTGVSKEVLDDCSQSQSDNMEENLDSGTNDEVAGGLSTLDHKLIEEGQLVDADASPSEHNTTSICLPHIDPSNSNVGPEETIVELLLQSDHKEPASEGLCPSSVLADDAPPNDLTSDKQEPGAIAAHNAEEFLTGLSNDVLDHCSLRQSANMEVNLDFGTTDDAAAESSTLADKLVEERLPVDANASPSENNSSSDPSSDSFNSDDRLEDNQLEEPLQFDHEAPANKDLCPGSVLVEDAVPYELTSDQQEHGSISVDNAEGLSDKVLDNCSLSHSDNMEENLDSGFKEQLETGVVTEGVAYDEKESASKDLCPTSVLVEDAVPNELTSDQQEHGSTSGDNAEGLSDEDLGNCSLSQSDNMDENFDSGFKEQLETGVLTEGVTYDEKEPATQGLCPSSVLADDAVPNDITSDKQEHGAVAADYAEDFGTGFSNEVLDSMEENLDSGLKEQPGNECIVTEGVTYGEQEPESKGLCPSSVLADNAVPNDITPDKLEQGAIVEDDAEEFDAGSSFEVLDNCSVNPSDDMEEKLDSDFKEQLETRPIVSVGVSYGEQELKQIDSEKELAAGLSSSISLDHVGDFDQSNEMEVENSESGQTEQAEADSGPMEQVEAESDTVEAKGDLDAPTFRSQGEVHAEEYANLEASASKKSVSSPIKAVEDLQEPGTLGDGITLHESPSEDSDEENQGEEFKTLFATPYVSHSKDEKKASLDGDSRDEALNQEGQGEYLKSLFATPFGKDEKKASLDGDSRDEALNKEEQVSRVSDNDPSSAQSLIRGCGEHDQGEYLKSLFATPFGSRSSKVEIATCIRTNETSSQYKHSCHENENTASSAGDGLTQSVTPSKDTSEDEAGEELKHLFATPSVVKQSVEGQRYLFQSQLRGDTILTREGLGSSGKENLSESFGSLIKDMQVQHEKTPVSMKCTNQETTSTEDEYSQSHEMDAYVCSGVGRIFSESEAGSVRVDQAPETSHITAFDNVDESEQEDKSRMLFASPIITQSFYEMDGTSRKTEGKKNLLSGNVQGHSHNKAFPVAQLSSMDLDEPDSRDSKHSETAYSLKDSSGLEEENNEGQGNMLSATSDKSMTPVWNDEFSSQEPTVKVTAACMKECSALEEENNEDGQGNMMYSTSDKSMTPLWNHKFCSQESTVKETAECMEESNALEEENNEGQDNMLSATSAINMTPLREFSSQEPKRADVATPEMFRDTDMNTRHECCVQEIVGIEVHKIEETVQDRDLLLRGTYRGLEEERTSPVSSEPTCDDIEFSKQQMVPEINRSSLKNVKTSDAFNEGIEDHLKLLFATPMKGTSPSRLGEPSSCQLKTAMIAMASEMAGKQPKQGSLFSGEPLTVEFISGVSDSTKGSCFSKEFEQFERGPLFPTPSKCASSLQLEENLGCEEDMLKDLDGVKFLNSQEQNFAQHEDCQLPNETTDDTDEATLHWFQSNDGSVSGQTELETLIENDSVHLFNPLHEKGEVTEDDDLAEGKEDDHLVEYHESLEDRLINTDVAGKGCSVSDAVPQQPNILLTDTETENINQESTTSTNGNSVSAEYYVVENDSSTEEFTASTNECQHVSEEDDLAAERNRLVILESIESSTPMNVNESREVDLPGTFAGESGNKARSALSEEPQSEIDQGMSSAARREDGDSFDKKEQDSTEAVLSTSPKPSENISILEEGFAGEEDTLMSEKINDLAGKKVPLTPAAGVAKTSFAKHLNSTVKKKNARSILIHGTPNKLSQVADMKENAPSVKGDIGTLTALRPEKRRALKDLPRK